jgi:ATP-dependent Clp protease ATP-binding subunit ClpA
MGTFRDLVKQANAKARTSEQVLALAHLYTVVLDELAPSGERYAAASTRINEQILPQLSKASRGYPKDQDVATFAWQDAERSYLQHSKGKATDNASAQSVLEWLLTVDFTDTSQKWCREACRRVGLLGAPQAGAEPTVPELGFGRPLDNGKGALGGLFGRDSELTKHLGFLTLALQQNSHYLLVGKPGVGKSYFLEHLLTRAASNSVTSGRKFVLFGRRDFLGSEAENKERFGRLYAYLQQNPDTVPVFDELEHILRHAPNLAEHFSALFGSALAGGGRTFVLVCDSAVASSTPLLKGLRPCSLPPLPIPAARQMLLEERLPELVGRHEFGVEPSPEALVDALLNTAPQRYPGRFMPELALHLAESAINRARHRIQFLQQAPLTSATVEDLWAHVVEEQGLNPEIFGKDPKEFYANLRSRLDNKVIGQNHAVAQICSVLEMQAHRPPQRAPRGRFLFVGPPGVGKTELARSLAKELGFGDEGFFVFNMSEYSSESARTRFMGADPGYVGFSTTRTIYQCVRERPACVILLDEIDRADASIQDILLSIMEGEGKDAEGQPVYFSQVIFVMTTNLGQEAVQAAYADVLSGKRVRAEIVKLFADEQLRRLVLEGATDETELAMQKELDARINEEKGRFAAGRERGDSSLDSIARYSDLKELRQRLERTVRTSPLDRALLDRIDFIMPFFPIKEPELLARILDLKLRSFGWEDCPAETKQEILSQAIAQQESVRPLERLVKKYLCKETT